VVSPMLLQELNSKTTVVFESGGLKI